MDLDFFEKVMKVLSDASDWATQTQQVLLRSTLAENRPLRKPRVSGGFLKAFFDQAQPKNVLNHDSDVCLFSKYFSPIEVSFSQPLNENLTALFSYASVEMEKLRNSEYDIKEIYSRLANSFRYNYVDPLTIAKVEVMMDRFNQAFPTLMYVCPIIHHFTQVNLLALTKVYFKRIKSRIRKTKVQHPKVVSFFSIATYYCKACKKFICDLHYPANQIKNLNLTSFDGNLAEKLYFVDGIDQKLIKKLLEVPTESRQIFPTSKSIPSECSKALAFGQKLFDLKIVVPSFLLIAAEDEEKRSNFADLFQYTSGRIEPSSIMRNTDYQFNSREIKRSSTLCQVRGEADKNTKGCQCWPTCQRVETGKKVASGCSCAMQLNKECIPNVCACNCAVNPQLVQHFPYGTALCKNTNYFFRVKTGLRIRRSLVCYGYGLFATRRFEKGDFIGYYLGEYLTSNEENLQDAFSKILDASYLFTIKTSHFNILDAFCFGNQTRFINHMPSSVSNLDVREICSNEGKYVGFVASKTIEANEELYFDYGKDYILKWRSDFDDKVAIYAKESKLQRDRAKKRKFITEEEGLYTKLLR